MSMIEQCKLCHISDRLRRSHILSEFVYRALYDEHHRFFDLGTAGGKGVTFQQKGLRERLLCEHCERKLSTYEAYVAPLLKRPEGLAISSHNTEIVNCVDYVKFKCFQLSILWRAHVSTHPLFGKINVGMKHAERLRAMLLAGEPGEPHEYGCVMVAVNIGDSPMTDFIGPSIHLRKDGHNNYTLIFAGFAWCFTVSSHSQTHAASKYWLQRDGCLSVFPFDVTKSPGFLGMALVNSGGHNT
jgi:hypothetical protein